LKQCPLTDPNLKFDEKSHTYWLDTDPDLKFTSVTTFISSFFAPFDAVRIATNLVQTHPKYTGYTVKQLLAEWRQSGTHGTKVHNEIENFILGNLAEDEITEKKAELGVEYVKEKFYSRAYNLYPEVRIYSKKYQLSGTIDLLGHDPSRDRYIIGDWKTNKKITTTAYKGKTGIKPATVDIEDCKLNTYGLQMSLYRYILETEYNADVRRQILIHLKEDERDIYYTTYMIDTVKKMLNYRQKQLTSKT
jgi:hypothetical protein